MQFNELLWINSRYPLHLITNFLFCFFIIFLIGIVIEFLRVLLRVKFANAICQLWSGITRIWRFLRNRISINNTFIKWYTTQGNILIRRHLLILRLVWILRVRWLQRLRIRNDRLLQVGCGWWCHVNISRFT